MPAALGEYEADVAARASPVSLFVMVVQLRGVMRYITVVLGAPLRPAAESEVLSMEHAPLQKASQIASTLLPPSDVCCAGQAALGCAAARRAIIGTIGTIMARGGC